MNRPYLVNLVIISAFSASALFFMWRRIMHQAFRSKGKGKDYGLVFLAGAMCVWMLTGLWGFLKDKAHPLLFESVRSLLSTANSLMYMLAVQHFDYSPHQIRRKWWQPTIIGVCSLIAILTIGLCILGWTNASYNTEAIWYPDVVLSFLTVLILGLGFWRSFYYRNYKPMAWLSLVVMAFVLFVQLPEISPPIARFLDGPSEDWFTLSAFGLLMMLCFALAASWGIEQVSIPDSKHIALTFAGKESKGWVIRLKIRDQRTDVLLSPMNCKNLLLFAARRLERPDNGWVHLDDDLKGYNYFRRILMDFSKVWHLNGILPDTAPEESVENVRRFLFEYQNPGQYRLNVDAANLRFDETFTAQKDDLVGAMRASSEKKETESLFDKIGRLI